MAVAIGLLDDAYPPACLHCRRDVNGGIFVVQVERFGRDDLTGYGDLNGLAGVVTLDLAIHSIGRYLRRFVAGCGLRFLLNLFALARRRTFILGGRRAGKNERNNTDTHCLHSYLSWVKNKHAPHQINVGPSTSFGRGKPWEADPCTIAITCCDALRTLHVNPPPL